MKGDGRSYRQTIIGSAVLTLIPGVVLVCYGFLLWFQPHMFIDISVTDKVKEDSLACEYNGVHLCQVSDNLSKFPLGILLKSAGQLVATFGAVILISAILGVAGVIFKSKKLMFTMIIFLCGSAAFEFTCMEISENPLHEFHDYTKKELFRALGSHYKITGRNETEFTKGLNLIMMTLGCCSMSSWTELYSNYLVVDAKGQMHTFSYPPACCDFSHLPNAHTSHPINDDHKEDDKDFINVNNSTYMPSNRDNLTTINSKHHLQFDFAKSCLNGRILALKSGQVDTDEAHSPSCYDRVHSLFSRNYGSLVLAVLMITIYIQSIQVVYAFMVLLTLKPKMDHIADASRTMLSHGQEVSTLHLGSAKPKIYVHPNTPQVESSFNSLNEQEIKPEASSVKTDGNALSSDNQ